MAREATTAKAAADNQARRVTDFLKNARGKRRENAANVQELLELIMGEFGGKQEFAKAFYHVYQNAAGKPTVQSRMLEAVLRLQDKITDRGGDLAAVDLEAMDEEEMKNIEEQLANELIGAFDGEE